MIEQYRIAALSFKNVTYLPVMFLCKTTYGLPCSKAHVSSDSRSATIKRSEHIYRHQANIMSSSHVGDVDDPFVAEACGPEVHALLLAELEVLAAALARQEGSQEVLRYSHLLVLQVQPI